MRAIDDLLDDLYVGRERLTRDEICRGAVAADLPADVITVLEALPEGEYAQDEASEAIRQLDTTNHDETGRTGMDTEPFDADVVDTDAVDTDAVGTAAGIPAGMLSDEDLSRELASLHRTREDALRHGSQQALEHHIKRMAELEEEYLTRFPEREVDPERLRSGARARDDG